MAQDLLEDQELPLELQCGGHIPGNLIALKDVGFHYPNGEWLFRNAELGVDGKSRIVFRERERQDYFSQVVNR